MALAKSPQQLFYESQESRRLAARNGYPLPPTPVKVNGMNLRSLVALSDDTITTIRIYFAVNDIERVFLCKKVLAEQMKPGSLVVVDTSRGGEQVISTAKVSKIDPEADIDPENGIEYQWCFGIVPLADLDGLKAEHEAMFKEIASVRKQGLKDKVKALLGAGLSITLDGKNL